MGPLRLLHQFNLQKNDLICFPDSSQNNNITLSVPADSNTLVYQQALEQQSQQDWQLFIAPGLVGEQQQQQQHKSR